MNIYNALNERFELLQKNQKEFHDDFLTESSKKISKVKFSKNSLMGFFPFENECFGLKKGNEIEQPKNGNKNYIKNYLDENGGVVMVEDILPSDKVTARTFYFRNKGFVERIIFQKIGVFKLKSVGRYFNDINNNLYLNKGAKGEACWNFNYSDDTLDSISVEEKDLLSKKISSRRLVLNYKDNGELKEVKCLYENGSSQIMFKG